KAHIANGNNAGDSERSLAHALENQEKRQPAQRFQRVLNDNGRGKAAEQPQCFSFKAVKVKQFVTRLIESSQHIYGQEKKGGSHRSQPSEGGSAHAPDRK